MMPSRRTLLFGGFTSKFENSPAFKNYGELCVGMFDTIYPRTTRVVVHFRRQMNDCVSVLKFCREAP